MHNERTLPSPSSILGEPTFCGLDVVVILLDPEEIEDLGLLHREPLEGLGGRGAVGAVPGPDRDHGGDGAQAEGVAGDVASVAEEQLVLAVPGAAGVAENGFVARAGDVGRRVDGARAAHDVGQGAEAARRGRLRGRRGRAPAPELRRARRRRRRAAAHGWQGEERTPDRRREREREGEPRSLLASSPGPGPPGWGRGWVMTW